MKKLSLATLLLIFSHCIFAQQCTTYTKLYISSNWHGVKCNYLYAVVDFGNRQNEKFLFSYPVDTIKDASGQLQKFNSEVDIFNFISRKGWDIVCQLHNSNEFLLKNETGHP